MRGAGFLLNIANYLGIPIGVKRIKAGNVSTGVKEYESQVNELVDTIVDITKDDICIGETPLFYRLKRKRVGNFIRERLDNLIDELNKVVQGATVGILKNGYAVYTYKILEEGKTSKIVFRPIIKDVELFLDYKNDVVVFTEDGQIDNVLPFVFYEDSNLEEVEEGEQGVHYLKINPKGLQLKNSAQAAKDLSEVETSIKRLRNQIRYIRFATVEVGVNVGNLNQEIVDDISEGLNANSQDLHSVDYLDDSIPVYPIRRGMGKPEVHEFAPTVNIGELPDLEHYLSKLFTTMRFPKAYADFTQNLNQTAVSMIRGDIRYSKLIQRGRSIIESAIADWIKQIPLMDTLGVQIFLTTIPTPEDDDVTASLEGFTDFTENAINFVIGESMTKEEALSRLDSLTALYSNSTNLKSIEKWTDTIIKIINTRFEDEEEPESFDKPYKEPRNLPGPKSGGPPLPQDEDTGFEFDTDTEEPEDEEDE